MVSWDASVRDKQHARHPSDVNAKLKECQSSPRLASGAAFAGGTDCGWERRGGGNWRGAGTREDDRRTHRGRRQGEHGDGRRMAIPGILAITLAARRRQDCRMERRCAWRSRRCCRSLPGENRWQALMPGRGMWQRTPPSTHLAGEFPAGIIVRALVCEPCPDDPVQPPAGRQGGDCGEPIAAPSGPFSEKMLDYPGSEAYADDGIVHRPVRFCRKRFLE
jgi:hypothetical protein